MNVAVIQLSSQDVVEDNLARARALVAEAARAGAELACLPENFAYMGEEEGKRGIAEAVPDGPISRAISAAARDAGIWVVAGGMPEASVADVQKNVPRTVVSRICLSRAKRAAFVCGTPLPRA